MASESGVKFCGRLFGDVEITAIRGIIASRPWALRREIAHRTCEALEWAGVDGRLKEMSCRVALLRLEARGLIRLPPPRCGNGNGRPYVFPFTLQAPEAVVVRGAGRWRGLRLRMVESRADSRLWNEAIGRFHYLGFKPLCGAQIRYLVEADAGLLGSVGFSASAWKVKPRDEWIGWSAEQREGRLHLVVNNSRFLILPWIRSPNLASWVLGRCARTLPADWHRRYGYEPVLAETFVERGRFLGTCYRAANWTYVGDTQGRGKLDRRKEYALPVKQIYVYPLRPGFREVLCS